MSPNTSGNTETTGADALSTESPPGDERGQAALEDDASTGAAAPDSSADATEAPAADARRTDAGETPGDARPDESSADDGDEVREGLEREVAQLNDRYLRLAAEFENYRKRVRNEQKETWARAQADLVRGLLDAVDDLQRVALLDPETATVQDIVEGVDMVERKLLRALTDAGLEVLDPAGEDFDPQVMEAMMMAPASSEEEDDTVDMVFQRGYLMEGHLVRPARVSVRKHG